MTNDPGNVYNAKPYNGKISIYVGDGNCLNISHIGKIKLQTQNGISFEQSISCS